MKNLRKAFANMATKYKPKCDPTPGKWNSCEPCKDCGKRAKYPESDTTPCCIITPPLVFQSEQNIFPYNISNEITINVNCQTRLYFTAYQTDGKINTGILFIQLNGSIDIQLDEGNPVAIDVNNGDTLRFILQYSGVVCWECYVYNETCNIQNTICLSNFCDS